MLKEAGELDQDDPAFVALRRATAGFFKAAKNERRRAHRQAVAAADRAVVELTAHRVCRPHRRRDRGPAAHLDRQGRDRRPAPGASRLLHLQAEVRRRRRVLPPALPRVCGLQPRQARRAHRPHRPPRSADRRPGQDRHVHRPAPAARRCRPDHHHPLPARRRTPLRQPARQRRVARSVAGRRHRPARPCPGDRPRRRRVGPGLARHPDQQRRADRPAYPGAYAPLAEAEHTPLPRSCSTTAAVRSCRRSATPATCTPPRWSDRSTRTPCSRPMPRPPTS